jgi:hypothetical protein
VKRVVIKGTSGAGKSMLGRDLERIRALHRSYFRELRAIVAASEPAQTVALVAMSLVELETPEAERRQVASAGMRDR